jgi:hypothetical protein
VRAANDQLIVPRWKIEDRLEILFLSCAANEEPEHGLRRQPKARAGGPLLAHGPRSKHHRVDTVPDEGDLLLTKPPREPVAARVSYTR